VVNVNKRGGGPPLLSPVVTEVRPRAILIVLRQRHRLFPRYVTLHPRELAGGVAPCLCHGGPHAQEPVKGRRVLSQVMDARRNKVSAYGAAEAASEVSFLLRLDLR